MKGMVTTDVYPHTLRGKVEIEHDTWSATSDSLIPVGKRVVVVSSEGVHVVVKEILEDQPKAETKGQ
jgi:membrane protein implicated in regulation of membrane protease activity